MGKRSNGEGSIYYDKKNKRWRASISIGRNIDGSLKRKQFTGQTQTAVLEKVNDFKKDLHAGINPLSRDITLEKYTHYYIFSIKTIDCKPSTIEKYFGLYRNYIQNTYIGSIKLSKLKTSMLQQYYSQLILEKAKSNNLIKELNKLIKSVLNQAIKEDLISKNPSMNVTLAKSTKTKKDLKYFSILEQEKLIRTSKGHKLEALFLLALCTGLRLGEILALQWTDIDFNKQTITVNKSAKTVRTFENLSKPQYSTIIQAPKTLASIRTIDFPLSLVNILKKHKQKQNLQIISAGELYVNNNLVFPTPLGKLMNESNLGKQYRKFLLQNNLPKLKFHALRHTFATRLLEITNSPKLVQTILGHSTISTTLDIYTHVSQETQKEAISKLNATLNL